MLAGGTHSVTPEQRAAAFTSLDTLEDTLAVLRTGIDPERHISFMAQHLRALRIHVNSDIDTAAAPAIGLAELVRALQRWQAARYAKLTGDDIAEYERRIDSALAALAWKTDAPST